MTQPEAEAECGRLYGAPLLALFTKLENEFVDALTGYNTGMTRVWIGLTCTASYNMSCDWSLGRGPPSTFTNFTVGNPNVANGNCIYQDMSTRYWTSAPCTDKYTFVCITSEIKEDPCLYQFNDHCYFPSNTSKNFGDAQDYCAQNSSNLVSIDSPLENQFINSLFPYPVVIMLGGVATSKENVIWADYSVSGYRNIQNLTKENCIFTNLNSEDGLTGEWFTDSCVRETLFICKRPIGVF